MFQKNLTLVPNFAYIKQYIQNKKGKVYKISLKYGCKPHESQKVIALKLFVTNKTLYNFLVFIFEYVVDSRLTGVVGKWIVQDKRIPRII